MTLALTNRWQPIAIQHVGERWLEWRPLMARSEYFALLIARDAGRVLTAQRRRADGRFELVAKLGRGSV